MRNRAQARRAEDIENAGAIRSGPHGVRDVARRAPEVTCLDRDLLAALNAHGRAFKQDAPLLFGVVVHDAFGVRRDGHHRQHRLLAGKDMRGEPRRKLAEQAIVRAVQVVELGLLAHRRFLSIMLRSRPTIAALVAIVRVRCAAATMSPT
jgi:hypothetical protein